ncbi:MAG: M90 family metallopeptidase [Phycisphaerales bacterium]
MLRWFRNRRRKRLRNQPLPAEWWAVIDRHAPAITRLTPEERRRLGGIVRVLLDEKDFEGCGGLTVTQDMRLVITAVAALPVLNLPAWDYPGLYSILIYPDAYRVKSRDEEGPAGIITEEDEVRLGEAWTEGSLVLSWNNILDDCADPNNGLNTILHEFAHLIDAYSGDIDGGPPLPNAADARAWSKIVAACYERHTEDVEAGRDTLIDPYGATEPAEFFAVTTELFFERPVAMRAQHGELYEQFARFYAQDPAERIEAAQKERGDRP